MRGPRRDTPGPPEVRVRFFTAEGELPACGHGTVAALAFLASRAETGGEAGAGPAHQVTLRTSVLVFDGWVVRDGLSFSASFDPGPVCLRMPTAAELGPVLAALGIAMGAAAAGVRVAGVRRERMLVPVASRAALAALDPDLDGLRDACDRLGLLGAYVSSPPAPTGGLAARMFAPPIGVPEDIANANSTACMAALLARRGITRIAVDMGDAVGSPSTITATARPGPWGVRIRVGGTGYCRRTSGRPAHGTAGDLNQRFVGKRRRPCRLDRVIPAVDASCTAPTLESQTLFAFAAHSSSVVLGGKNRSHTKSST
ncbi:PhzF family phenazine biosynthesis protein [Streptomyces sp. NPDC057695]|uniref:PhzF family phenazine biosynthesis protein n=1 Tax=Streptomyces sp. NPDC057695 TaxID=3346217 RepID=UPI0036A8C234